MNETEIAKLAVQEDLSSSRFLAGTVRNFWRLVSFEFPNVFIAVKSVNLTGTEEEYVFRFEVTGYKAIAPQVFIWDYSTNAVLPVNKRPQGSPRVAEAFKDWGPQTVYRPWDRDSGAHNNWNRDHPSLAWHDKRDLTFILEDLHGLLTSNCLALAS